MSRMLIVSNEGQPSIFTCICQTDRLNTENKLQILYLMKSGRWIKSETPVILMKYVLLK
jgi:hypothetical protein